MKLPINKIICGDVLVELKKLGRDFIGIELNPAYCEIARKRLAGTTGNLFAQTK